MQIDARKKSIKYLIHVFFFLRIYFNDDREAHFLFKVTLLYDYSHTFFLYIYEKCLEALKLRVFVSVLSLQNKGMNS